MTSDDHNGLWRDFPKTAQEIDARFGTEENRFADGQVAADAQVVSDGHAGYNRKSLGERPHAAIVQTKAERRESDAVQSCHWTISLLNADSSARTQARCATSTCRPISMS